MSRYGHYLVVDSEGAGEDAAVPPIDAVVAPAPEGTQAGAQVERSLEVHVYFECGFGCARHVVYASRRRLSLEVVKW